MSAQLTSAPAFTSKKAAVSFIRELASHLDHAAESFGWSNPVEQTLNAARQEEKRHRTGSTGYKLSVEDGAKCLVVRDFAAYISGERKPITMSEVLECRHSAVLACATLENEKYGPTIRAIYTPEVVAQALALNYAELVA